MFDIITDSACDLTLDTAKQLGIEVVPFYVSLDGEHYRKEGLEIPVRDFYQFMVDNPAAYPKTSLASIEDFEKAFRAHAEAGRAVLCLVFTGKMSGCVGSARNARDLVLEDYPEARIEVIDSAAATVTESTMVENAVAMRDAGCTLDETVTWLEAEKANNLAPRDYIQYLFENLPDMEIQTHPERLDQILPWGKLIQENFV